MLLFDTHVWIWVLEHDPRLGNRTLRLIVRAEALDSLRVSSISVFEVPVLHVAGALRVSQPLDQWIRAGLERVRVTELSTDTAIDAGYIPRNALPDPADRLLVATARQLDATLVTAERAILTYARGGHVRVQDARK